MNLDNALMLWKHKCSPSYSEGQDVHRAFQEYEPKQLEFPFVKNMDQDQLDEIKTKFNSSVNSINSDWRTPVYKDSEISNISSISWEEPGDGRIESPPVCECGSAKVGSPNHSGWCPIK
jgi:hypothetical protein